MKELQNFFTPRTQYDLIQTAQMQNESFEDAMIKYRQSFTCGLTDILVRNYKKYQKYKVINAVMNYIGLSIIEENGEGIKYSFQESVTTRFFTGVINCYNQWITCRICDAIDTINEQIEELLTPTPDVNSLELDPHRAQRFYRGRISQTTLGKSDMFHIKFKELHKIRNQRFSLVGQPLLYLGASVQCVAEEMHINSMHQEQIEQLFVSQYTLIENEINKSLAPLFDMRLYIQDSFFEESTDEAVREMQFRRFLLSCLCSFNNYHNLQNAHFIEEYIIPQLVIQEVRKTKAYSGICYYSTRFIPEDESTSVQTIRIGRTRATISDERPIQTIYSAAENYAFFTDKHNDDEPWDSILRKRFDITMPVSISELRRNSISFQGSEDSVLSFECGIKLLDDYYKMRDAQEKALFTQEWYGAYRKFKKEEKEKNESNNKETE